MKVMKEQFKEGRTHGRMDAWRDGWPDLWIKGFMFFKVGRRGTRQRKGVERRRRHRTRRLWVVRSAVLVVRARLSSCYTRTAKAIRRWKRAVNEAKRGEQMYEKLGNMLIIYLTLAMGVTILSCLSSST